MTHLARKQDTERINICRRLGDEARRARVNMEDWRMQAERLIRKIDFEIDLLENLYQQVERTGDRDGFASDISDKQDIINGLRRKIERAQDITHQWEAEAAMLDRQMIANNCDNFA